VRNGYWVEDVVIDPSTGFTVLGPCNGAAGNSSYFPAPCAKCSKAPNAQCVCPTGLILGNGTLNPPVINGYPLGIDINLLFPGSQAFAGTITTNLPAPCDIVRFYCTGNTVHFYN